MTRRAPRGKEPAEVFHTRLDAIEEAPRLFSYAKEKRLNRSAALRDLARLGMGLPSLFPDLDPE